jgi:hypothetical protein
VSEKFKTILADLTSTASAFHTESGAFNKIMSGSATPVPADGGDASLNAAIKLVLDELVALHSGMAASMFDHGDKLQLARDNYHAVDQSMHELFDDLMPDQ